MKLTMASINAFALAADAFADTQPERFAQALARAAVAAERDGTEATLVVALLGDIKEAVPQDDFAAKVQEQFGDRFCVALGLTPPEKSSILTLDSRVKH